MHRQNIKRLVCVYTYIHVLIELTIFNACRGTVHIRLLSQPYRNNLWCEGKRKQHSSLRPPCNHRSMVAEQVFWGPHCLTLGSLFPIVSAPSPAAQVLLAFAQCSSHHGCCHQGIMAWDNPPSLKFHDSIRNGKQQKLTSNQIKLPN